MIRINLEPNNNRFAASKVVARLVELRATAPFKSKYAPLQALSAIFGLDVADDLARIKITREKILPLLTREPQILNKALELLPEYSAWTASGAHRLMPVAVAMINLFKGRDIFDPRAVRELQGADPMFDYLIKIHPFYANPFSVPQKYIPDLPCLVLPKPREGGKFKYLDIATAPKRDGSPTLNMFKRAFSHCLGGAAFAYYGTDIALPYFQLTDGGVSLSRYVDPASKRFRAETIINDIKYCRATEPRFDAMSDGFFPDDHFDFISVCMALHHLKLPGENEQTLPLSSLTLVNSEGQRINNELTLLMAPSTQRTVDRLLNKLNVGGMLFVNIFFPGPDIHRHSDMFFIVRKAATDLFVVYDRAPIPFMPKVNNFSPLRELNLIKGRQEPHGFYIKLSDFCNPGIISIYPGQPDEFYLQIEKLFDRADLLVLRHQIWGKGAWGSVVKVAQATRDRRPLTEMLAIYLENVPATDPLKIELLADANKLASFLP